MKTWLQRGVSLLLICLLAGPIAIQADTIEKIILTAKENQVEAVLIPSDTKDTIRSLQLSFQIKAKQGKVLKEHVQFKFHQNIKSDVQEWRYQEDTGRLTVYLSGDEHLYAQDELRLGTVELKLAAGTKAEVSVIEDSLKTVNDVYAVNEVSGMDAIAPVTIEKAGSGDNNVPSETPDTNKPQENDKESTTEGKPEIPDTGKPDNSQENTPLDASKADTSEKAQNKGSVDKAEKGVDTGDKTQAQIYALGMLGALVAGSILWILRKKKELQIK